jgi:hypothetical protein
MHYELEVDPELGRLIDQAYALYQQRNPAKRATVTRSDMLRLMMRACLEQYLASRRGRGAGTG